MLERPLRGTVVVLQGACGNSHTAVGPQVASTEGGRRSQKEVGLPGKVVRA